MATTSPDNIYFPTTNTQVAPLETQFALQASSIQEAFNTRAVRTYKVADLNALALLTNDVDAGDTALVFEGGATFRRIGSMWAQATPALFASVAARDTAYAKASGAFRVPGAASRVANRLVTDVWQGAPSSGGWMPEVSEVQIRPTVLTQGGAAQTSIDPDGTLIFNNLPGTGVLVQDIFTDEFDEYRIDWWAIGTATNQGATGINIRWATGAVQDTANLYYYAGQRAQRNEAGPGSWHGTALSFNDIGRCGPSTTGDGRGTVEVINPADATKRTRAQWRATGSDGTTDVTIDAGGAYQNAKRHDGFVFWGAANINGRLRIYGRTNGA